MTRQGALLALLLGGCTTVGPDYSRPAVPAPERFAEAGTRAGPSDPEIASWWQVFGDEQLAQLVQRALSRNLDVQIAAARIREARAREVVAGASTKPQLSPEASATRQRISENAIPIPPGAGNEGGLLGLPGSEFNSFRIGFDASWEIDLFGRTRRSIEAARARTGAAVWNRRDVEVSVAAEVARAYLTLRELQERIALAQSDLDRRRRFERLVEARARGGLVTRQDLEQQRSERAAAEAAIPALRAQADAQVHALGVLSGEMPQALVAELSQARAMPSAPPEIPPGIPSDLLRRRPDIRASERELAAATADIGVAVADLYPRFSLTAAPALVSTALASLLEWGSRSFTAGAGLVWPLLDGGRSRANVEMANARQEQALIAYRKVVLVALQDVEDSLSRTDAGRGQLASLHQALANAQRAEAIALARYRGGLVTYSDVLITQARRLELEEQMIQAKGALARDSVALFKALGGGWPELAQAGAQQ